MCNNNWLKLFMEAGYKGKAPETEAFEFTLEVIPLGLL
jgi:hypothetical protein